MFHRGTPNVSTQPPEVSTQPFEVPTQPSEVSTQPSELSAQPSELSAQPPEVPAQPPNVSAQPPSPIYRLPQEIVEKILSHFIYDFLTLLACSMTCHSWYTAAVPHLHHSLTTHDAKSLAEYQKYMWPRPLKSSYELGLLPLVRRFRICLWYSKFAPTQLDGLTPTVLFRTHEPPGTRDRLPSSVELYANNSTVLRTPIANSSIPRP